MAHNHNAEHPPRLLVIGLDGATFDLIKPWAAEGKLPTLARLIAEGSHGLLRSVPNMNSAGAWTSFATGKNPGKHGIYYFDEHVDGSYQKRFLSGSARDGVTFWQYLSRAGKRQLIVNVPMTYPAEAINGCMLAGEDTPSTDSPGFAYPAGLAAELRQNVGDYIIDHGIWGFMKQGRKDLALERLLQTIDKRQAYARYLLQRKPWDLAVVVFTESDAAHHVFWRDMDPRHPDHTAQGAAQFADAIQRVYQKLDACVAELLADAGPATVIIMSDHGGGFDQRGSEYLNGWLADRGYLVYERTEQAPAPGNAARRAVRTLAERIYRLLDKRLNRESKRKLQRLLPGVRERVESSIRFKNIDWTRTRAYADGVKDEVWINLRGREPQGVVDPAGYDALADELRLALQDCRDAQTGQPVVEWVRRRDELYQGPHVGRAPDLSIHWRAAFVISGLLGKDGRPIARATWLPRRQFISGGHRPDGILIAWGEQVRHNVEVLGAQLMDLCPTILHLMGQPAPADMDGTVLHDLLSETQEQAAAAPGVADVTPAPAGEAYSAEEAAAIEERLRGLGYIE